jgi:hypothetical protein
MVHYMSVSCLFGHYPSSNLIKSQRFRDWLCLRLQVMDFILDHLCVVLSPLLTSQLILFFILSFYLTQTF